MHVVARRRAVVGARPGGLVTELDREVEVLGPELGAGRVLVVVTAPQLGERDRPRTRTTRRAPRGRARRPRAARRVGRASPACRRGGAPERHADELGRGAERRESARAGPRRRVRARARSPSTRTISSSPNGGVPNPAGRRAQADVLRRAIARGREHVLGERVQRIACRGNAAGRAEHELSGQPQGRVVTVRLWRRSTSSLHARVRNSGA